MILGLYSFRRQNAICITAKMLDFTSQKQHVKGKTQVIPNV